MNPKVSAVIPLYNAEKYIGACIRSILAQTMKEIEIIVVDDRGTDGSVEVVRGMMAAPGGECIHLVSLEKNSRAGIARNTGLAHARGEFVIFIDSDDEIVPEMFETMYAKAVEEGSDVCLCDAAKILPDGKVLCLGHPADSAGEVTREKRAYLLTNYVTAMWTMLLRRSFLLDNEIYFTPEKYEDSFFVPLVFLYAGKVSYVKEPFYRYFVRDNSICTTVDDTKYKQKVSLFDNLLSVLKQRGLYEPYREELDYVYLKKAYLVPTFNYVLNSLRPSKKVIRSIRAHMEEIIPGGTSNSYFRHDARARLMDGLFKKAPALGIRAVRLYSKASKDLF